MSSVTKLNESHQNILNDDDNKPFKYKVTRQNQGDRCFIEWSICIEHRSGLLDEYIDWIINQSDIRLQKRSLHRFRQLTSVILLNLGKCLIQRRWLQIPKSKSEYERGKIPHNLGFTNRHVVHILNFLEQQELIYAIKGAKYKKDPQLSAYQPTELFDARLSILSMSSLSDFEVELVKVNKPDIQQTTSHQRQIEDDNKNLRTINNFLKGHSYPFKGPMKRIYRRCRCS